MRHNRASGKAAAQKAGKSKRPVPWDDDRAGQGGPTSWDVLLGWLRVPENYEQWHGGDKSQASMKIVSMLQLNGISHRTVTAVQAKVRTLIDHYLSPVKILQENDLPSNYLETEDADGKVKARVLKACPEYRALMPAFREFDFHGMEPKDLTLSDDSDDSDYDRSCVPKKTRRKAADSGSRVSKRLRSSTKPSAKENTRTRRNAADRSSQETAIDTAYQAAAVEQDTAADGFSQETAIGTAYEAAVVEQDTATSTGNGIRRTGIFSITCRDPAAEDRRKKESRMLDHVEELFKLQLTTTRVKDECEVGISRCRLQTEQHHAEVERGLCDMKRNTERHRQKMQLESEQLSQDFQLRRYELALKKDLLQSRQVLKNHRVSKDKLLPLGDDEQ